MTWIRLNGDKITLGSIDAGSTKAEMNASNEEPSEGKERIYLFYGYGNSSNCKLKNNNFQTTQLRCIVFLIASNECAGVARSPVSVDV